MKKLSELLNMDFPCGGKGICGKCKVYVSGELSPITDEEKRFLSPEDIKSGARLACRTYVLGDCRVLADEKNLCFTSDTEPLHNPAATDKEYGIALDIGTTTVAAYLCSLPDGKVVKTQSFKNPQSRFGADVISRIEYAGAGGLAKMQKELMSSINPFGVKPLKYTVAGNTAMLHILFGLNPACLGVSPFKPQSLFGEWEGDFYAASCISAFVGADTVCAIMASSMEEDTLLLDIGTNGEMVLFSNGKYYCCSASAGPALEGVGISCGMIAEKGAVSKVYEKDGKIIYETIYGAPAKGICGSGIADAAAVMLKTGAMDKSGYMEKEFTIAENVILRQKDIRALQLAKGAIRAGIETLIHRSSTCKIKKIYLAGAMGSAFRVESLKAIGMLPSGVPAVQVGNAAGEGAVMLLKDEYISLSRDIAKRAESINLATDDFFTEKFIENMNF